MKLIGNCGMQKWRGREVHLLMCMTWQVTYNLTISLWPQGKKKLTWLAEIPFSIAALTCCRSSLPTTRFWYRTLILTKRLRMAISNSFAWLSACFFIQPIQHTSVGVDLVVGLQDQEFLLISRFDCTSRSSCQRRCKVGRVKLIRFRITTRVGIAFVDEAIVL